MSTGGNLSVGSGGKGGNVFDQSAAALSGAGSAFSNAADLFNNPGLANRQAATFDPVSMQAASVNTPDAILKNIKKYMNPFSEQVIDASLGDIDRARRIQQVQNAGNAVAAGAFGGGRHGVVESLTNEAALRESGLLSSNLRREGFNTAAGLSQQDIQNLMAAQAANAAFKQQANINNQQAINDARRFNANQEQSFNIAQSADEQARAAGLAGVGSQGQNLGSTLFGLGNSINQQQAAQGALQQALAQAVMSLGSDQFSQYMNYPRSILDLLNSAAGGSPLIANQTTTQKRNPGLLDWASLIGQTVAGIAP